MDAGGKCAADFHLLQATTRSSIHSSNKANNYLVTAVRICRAVLVFFWLSDGQYGAAQFASADSTLNLARSVSLADAVIHGKVVRIEYRMSDQTGDGDSLPYAFVTYKILKVVRGRVLGETLTIRALGGLDHSDRLLFVDHMPFFGIGDEDILLVRGNGQRVCPFVNCSFGRFRIANDRVYNGFAVPITVCKNGSLKLGNGVNASLLSATIPREVPSFDTMLKTPFAQKRIREMGAISLDALRERYNREAPKEITVTYGGEENSKSGPRQTEHSVLPEECGPVLTNEFLTMLHTEAARLPPSGLMESRRRLL